MDEVIVIAMTAHNDAKWLRRSIDSFLGQQGCHRDLRLVVSLDSSTDASAEIIRFYLSDPRIVMLETKFGSAYQNRNHILEYIRASIPQCTLMGRLDADDELNGREVLAKVENIFDRHHPDVILMGNCQRKNGKVSKFVNCPDASLLIPSELLVRLSRMAAGDWSAELPSCNTFFRPSLPVKYRNVSSAEDHWLLVELLLQCHRFKIHIDADLVYSIYSLDGQQTKQNQDSGRHQESRKQLLEFAKTMIAHGK